MINVTKKKLVWGTIILVPVIVLLAMPVCPFSLCDDENKTYKEVIDANISHIIQVKHRMPENINEIHEFLGDPPLTIGAKYYRDGTLGIYISPGPDKEFGTEDDFYFVKDYKWVFELMGY